MLPNTITKIGLGALEGCTSLEALTLPFVGATKDETSNTHFGHIFGAFSYSYNNYYVPSSLKTVVITSGTNINNRAFYGCTEITNIAIPNSVTRIGQSAFSGCTKLASITIPFVGATKDGTSNTHFGYIFGASSYSDNKIYVPLSLKTVTITGGSNIGNFAFSDCTGLTSIIIPDNVTNVGKGAFNGCTNLKYTEYQNSRYLGNKNNPYYLLVSTTSKDILSVQIHENTRIICHAAFSGCTRLTSITIPFVGTTKNGTNNTSFYYIFGDNSSIPSSLKHVMITGGTYIGSSAFYGCAGLTSITIPNSVTKIGNSAFYGCTGLTSITIPNSVTSIGYSAFSGCSGLKEVHISDLATWCKIAFDSSNANPLTYAHNLYLNDSLITALTIPDGITNIGEYAFYDCTGIMSITIPNSVTSIGYSAFFGCTGLTSIAVSAKNTKYHSSGNCLIEVATKTLILACKASVIPTDGSVTNIGDRAFLGCEGLTSITIPNSVTSIGEYAFEDCTRLTSIIIPDSVTSIGYAAFSGCSSLESITLPFAGGSRKSASDMYQYPFGYIFGMSSYTGGVATRQAYYHYRSNISSIIYYLPQSLKFVTITDENILDYAFYGCTELTSITIPNNVTSIGERAFYGCTGLTNITIPNNVTSIGVRAFDGCTGLTNITIPNSVTSIGGGAFSDCSGLTNITIPNSVTSIDGHAFADCSGLTSITISNGVTSISYGLFSGCTGLTRITIPNGITSIGPQVFKNCTKLTSITIPDGITQIYGETFSGCSGLTNITIPNSVTSIGDYAFSKCTELKDIYYTGSQSAWASISKGINWNYNTGSYTIHYNYKPEE